MYKEHYIVTLKRWQEYTAAQLDKILKTSADLVGFQYSIEGENMHVILFWRYK